jgi:hypothetical protein
MNITRGVIANIERGVTLSLIVNISYFPISSSVPITGRSNRQIGDIEDNTKGLIAKCKLAVRLRCLRPTNLQQ